ncbi:penicillin-binding protein 2, partial [Candidatus Aerophobetes bacterium]|nr:penicillin-binding protein 2 [Candidatus Aerophobetes bacterium]
MFYRVIEKTNLKFERRIKILGAIFGTLLVIILIRAAWLQILQGERFLQLSQSSRLRVVPVPNPRGLILDREQRVVADNSASFSVGIVPENIKDVTEILLKLKKVLPGMDIKIAEEKIKNTPNPFRPVVLQRNVDLSTITYLLEREEEFPPVVILAQPIRHYPQGELLGNIIGYVGEVNKQELKNFSPLGIEVGDFIGKTGIERRYNFYLQGEKGGRQVEIDAYGRALRVISEKQPSPGSILQLTIDLEMQKIAKEEMGERKGVVLISDPHTGHILAMLSLPSFDPNLLARGISEERWKELSQ